MSDSIKVPTWALPLIVSLFVGAISYGAAQANAQATAKEVERVEKVVEIKLSEKEKKDFDNSIKSVQELFEAAKKIDNTL